MAVSFSSIPGYHLSELLYDGSRTLVYRGKREIDQQPVVIKLLKNPYPNFRELVQFRNQYTIAKNLQLPGIIRPYCLEPYQNAYALVMEDFGGISLHEYTRTHPLDLCQFLAIALQLADILEGLYRERVIHKDLKKANILIHPDTREVRLIDFSIASLLPGETQEILSYNVLQGTLAYLSPEQTGRMNRGIDYRADFYSLGVTFYELLTGHLPFQVDDPMELVHCHIAQCPPSIHDLNPAIPPVLSRIVEKLMAKNAEDRYQSALGLKHHLERCLDQWKQTGLIEAFEIGQWDICDRFVIPEKLYGREQEVETLLNAFERVSLGATELMLVAGFSGIGKTAVVSEVHKPIVRQRGYFIKGKFDQFGRNIPLSAFVQAFRDLMGQLLSQSDVQLAQWKTKILDALGAQARVIVEVIPELERIIGQQQNVPELSGSAAQNRFNLLFQKFIQVFTTQDHPLVIFVDDLQWADLASLKLMQLLLSEAQTSYLFLIGAYRDNEVFPAHPLMLTLDDLQKNKVILNTIALAPLTETDLNQLIADTLSCATKMALPLTQLVYQKTQGNPFFSTQFLKALHDDGLITFDFECGYWQCDIAQVKAKALTDDVVEFMALQLQKLPPCTQTVLKLAACIGNQFDLGTLAVASVQSHSEAAANLWKALQEGLVIPTSEVYKFFQDDSSLPLTMNYEQLTINYKFLHDRVQQAAYSLIPAPQKQVTHLKIGQLLLQNTPTDQREEKIFEIVNQLNMGVKLITLATKREELAQLNLMASRKAKTATAFAAAAEYVKAGIGLLTEDCWHQYTLTLALHEVATETAYLNGDFEWMEQLAHQVLQHAKSTLDKVAIYEVRIEACAAQNNPKAALKAGLEILQQLGIEFPEEPSQADIDAAFQETAMAIARRSPSELLNLPEMQAANYVAALRIMMNLTSVAYAAKTTLIPLLILKQVCLSVVYGHAPTSAFAYSTYTSLLCGVIGDIASGYEFGQLALLLQSRSPDQKFKPRTLFMTYHFPIHWKEHLRNTLQPLQLAYSSSLEVGDLAYTGYCAYGYCFHAYFAGQPLADLARSMASYKEVLNKINQKNSLTYVELYRQVVLNLMGEVDRATCLIGEAYNEQIQMPLHHAAGNRIALMYLLINKLILAYLFEEFPQAVDYAYQAAHYLDAATAKFSMAIFHFYDSLIHLTQFSLVSQHEQAGILSRVATNQEKLQNWAHHAPMNHLHKFHLVEAERHRVLRQKTEAIDLYERAISGAKENEYIQEEALSNELAAKFYLEWGKEKIAQVYMTEAYYCYARWGALAKTDDLSKRYPQLLQPILQQKQLTLNPLETIATLPPPAHTIHPTQTSSSSTPLSLALDFATILKANQSLSSEIHLDRLLISLLNAVIANAGASKCVLMLLWDNDLRVEAIATLGQEPKVLQAVSIDDSFDVPVSLIYTVKRSLQSVVIADATKDASLVADSYIIQQQPKSLLCTPIVRQGKLLGILYMENHLTRGAFTRERVEVLNLLITQAAISLENARLYQKAQKSAQQIERSLQELQQAQTQLVQSEKMSSLGNLVAGVAHEINNPIGFLKGSLNNTEDYVKDLLNYVQCVQQHHPQLAPAVTEYAEEIDLEFLTEDLPKVVTSMKGATERIKDISTSLRTFSRADTSLKMACNVHEGIDSTLLILKYRIKANEHRPEIKVIKAYGELPLVKCFLGQLNQVFMNILANAIEAIDEESQKYSFNELKANPNKIIIQTSVLQPENVVVIRIKDNGPGMSQTVKAKVFDHLFTTKGVGKGTGLGLAIARQIVESTHSGKLICHSTLGEGTEFIIELPTK